MVIDKATGKAKEVDIYDRPEAGKKKAADPDKVRGMLSSNVEQSIIPAGTSKLFIKSSFFLYQRGTWMRPMRSTRLSMCTDTAPLTAARTCKITHLS